MPKRSSKRKTRRDSLTSSLGEPESSSLRTENIPSISDRDFSETSQKIEKSISRRVKDTETGQREILKMIENLSSKIDSLSGQTSSAVDLDANENRPECLIPTSRPIEVNELTRREGQHRECYITFESIEKNCSLKICDPSVKLSNTISIIKKSLISDSA